MEVFLKLTGLLLGTLLSDWLTDVLSRDFTIADIEQLYVSATPHPGGFKCFTCENAEDNYSCNRWAPDEYCPKDTGFCYTRHRMNSDGESVSVTKRCVYQDECVSTGCVQHQTHMVCISCCEGNICNLPVPWNKTEAIYSAISPLNHAIRVSPGKISMLCIIIITTTTTTFLVNNFS
ncbi:ly6/PLAUR domain-containing protein 6-like [Tachysurus vachellii]|uniref:ly6/PLAUR domain-containing protein 6-like n=1 Tax=Tachysurus vachellii TaxID=175792 RepID=UPI00296B14CB|nr:ly6/PLAUR domain-containing protein 6-like [Tachysurus vachellii]